MVTRDKDIHLYDWYLHVTFDKEMSRTVDMITNVRNN